MKQRIRIEAPGMLSKDARVYYTDDQHGEIELHGISRVTTTLDVNAVTEATLTFVGVTAAIGHNPQKHHPENLKTIWRSPPPSGLAGRS